MAVERDGNDIARPHRPIGGIGSRSVDADVAGADQTGSGGTGAHHPRVP
jgi:hypothetical protein